MSTLFHPAFLNNYFSHPLFLYIYIYIYIYIYESEKHTQYLFWKVKLKGVLSKDLTHYPHKCSIIRVGILWPSKLSIEDFVEMQIKIMPLYTFLKRQLRKFINSLEEFFVSFK